VAQQGEPGSAYERGSVLNSEIEGVESGELRKNLLEKLNLLQETLRLLIDRIRELLETQ
jgi:hypothetical protein